MMLSGWLRFVLRVMLAFAKVPVAVDCDPES